MRTPLQGASFDSTHHKEEPMGLNIRPAVWTVIMCLCFAVARSEKTFAKDKKLTPQEVVSRHVQSIGSSEILAAVKSRAFSGSASVQFISGDIGLIGGQCEFVSEEQKQGFFFRYNALEYPQEHFAFDGRDVTISYISPGRRSPLGDFLNRFDNLIKEGLMGGALSVNWPLLNLEPKRAKKMKYKKRKIDDRELHEIEYRLRKSMGDMKVKLYFDLDTFHHVKTEYRVSIRQQGSMRPITEGIHRDSVDSDTYYVLLEEYGDFREVDGMTLPHHYSIHYSREGGSGTFMALWKVEVIQWAHNGPINPQFYTVQ
jgi:hypothetical protein